MSAKVLVVDDKQIMRDSVGKTLQRGGFTVVAAGDGKAAIEMVTRHRPACVVTDLRMPEMDGLELLAALRQADHHLPVVLMTAFGSVGDAVEAMRRGAFDFIQKPFEGDQLLLTVRRAVEHGDLLRENAALRSEARLLESGPNLVGQAPTMRRLAQQIHQIAGSHGTVLIAGESGTGKEVVARTIHAHSPRRDRVMLCVNCAALSESLLESELFGHEKGAFTGADQLRKGRFELADGGTLLLDEISEISPRLQAKLLRVLQEGQFERVGSSLTTQVDVRVLATTNRDLTRSVAEGTFRQDLYYRLNVLPIELPALRERLEDVPLLAEHFLRAVAMREGREAKKFEPQAVAVLQRYVWPGNVRELQNICERASVLCRGPVISAELIEPWLPMTHGIGQAGIGRMTPGWGEVGAIVPASPRQRLAEMVLGSPPAQLPAPWPPKMSDAPLAPLASATGGGWMAPAVDSPLQTLEDMEREQILRALEHFGGNRQRSAEALGIGVRTLGLKLKKWKEMNLVAATV